MRPPRLHARLTRPGLTFVENTTYSTAGATTPRTYDFLSATEGWLGGDRGV